MGIHELIRIPLAFLFVAAVGHSNPVVSRLLVKVGHNDKLCERAV